MTGCFLFVRFCGEKKIKKNAQKIVYNCRVIG